MDAGHGDATLMRYPGGFLVPVHCAAAADLAGFPAWNRRRAVIYMPSFLANSRGIDHRGQVGRLLVDVDAIFIGGEIEDYDDIADWLLARQGNCRRPAVTTNSRLP
jgi:hypothetical protein